MQQMIVLAFLSTFAFAQFGTNTGISSATAVAIEWGKGQNAGLFTMLPFPKYNPSDAERAVAQLHGKLFNLAPRNTKLEADVAARLEPTLRALNIISRIAVLVVDDDRIPYARVTRDGIFVITSVLARKEFGTSRDFATGLFLRELARYRLLSEFGNAAMQASAEKLQAVDLKVTAGATILAKAAGVTPDTVKAAVIQFNTKVKGTQSTLETDKRLFIAEFQPVAEPQTKTPRFLKNFSTNRTYDELHTKGLNFAPTEDHLQVIAYFSK